MKNLVILLIMTTALVSLCGCGSIRRLEAVKVLHRMEGTQQELNQALLVIADTDKPSEIRLVVNYMFYDGTDTWTSEVAKGIVIGMGYKAIPYILEEIEYRGCGSSLVEAVQKITQYSFNHSPENKDEYVEALNAFWLRESSRDSVDVFLEIAAEREFGGGIPVDTIAVAEANGVDYEKELGLALKKSKKSLKVLFRVGTYFDAASSQGHAAILGDLLRELGDKHFAKCLRGESDNVVLMVVQDIKYDIGEMDEISRLYPRTYTVYYDSINK